MRAPLRVAVVGSGGGQTAAAGAKLPAAGLAVARLDEATITMVRALVGHAPQVQNPVDLGAETSAAELARVLQVVAVDPYVDTLIVVHTAMPWLDAGTFAGVLRSVGDPLVARAAVAVMPERWVAPSIACPRGAVPVFGSCADAVDAIRHRAASPVADGSFDARSGASPSSSR